MIQPKENERVIFAGYTALRSHIGEPLPPVRQYMIVPETEVEGVETVQLKDDERLVQVGVVLENRKNAEERFAALKAGRTPPPKEKPKSLYIIEDAANISPESGLSRNEEDGCAFLIWAMAQRFWAEKHEQVAAELKRNQERNDE